jgi:glycosyltransferase involved in cell wall biosynthesis
MRVLLMADSFSATGGGEVMVGYLARQLQQSHTVALLTAGPEATGHASWNGLDVYQVHSEYHPRLRPALSLVNPSTTRGVAGALRAFRPDVVHAWNVHHHLGYESLRLASKIAPVVHTAQDALAFCYTKFHCYIRPEHMDQSPPWPVAHPERCRSCRSLYWSFPVRNRIVRAYLERVVRTPIAVSHALAQALIANGLPNADVVHNGIPSAEFINRTSTNVDKRWELSPGPAVLAGGRLSQFKGHELALRAFHRAATAAPDAQLVIMGGYGWYGRHLAAVAEDLGIAERVRFLGLVPREDVPGVLHRSSAVLNLSAYLDPFPTMNLESMAAARAVVGTCFGGTPEAVEDGVSGYVVNPYDEACVSDRIARIFKNPDEATQLGNAGRERLLERFTIEQMAARYEAIYEKARTG